MSARIEKAAGIAAVLLATVALTACGDSEEEGSRAPDYDAALAGAPAPLAALYARANELIDGGTEAFEAQLADLRGHPVVVNRWASWCGPCRAEFGHFQRLSARFGKRVAFLGVDSNDSDDAARTFLSEHPVPYPSFADPDDDIAQSFNGDLALPSTAFFDASGELLYTKQGQYSDAHELAADIRRYAR
jgi:cytochrome c biogenesis protein CcmG/thiol:disulfide interchange protein DsbE